MNSSLNIKNEFKAVSNTLPSNQKPTIPENSNLLKDSDFPEPKLE